MKFSAKLGNGPVNKMTKFWWRSGSRIWIKIRIRLRIATLVRRALAEVCNIPVLPVNDGGFVFSVYFLLSFIFLVDFVVANDGCLLVKLLAVNRRYKFTECCNFRWILRRRRTSVWLT